MSDDPDLVNDLMAQIEHQRHLLGPLTEAATHLVWKLEQRERAYFNHHLHAGDRKEFGLEGPYPWRGTLDPAVVHLINVLEEYGLYDGIGEAADA